MRAFMVLLVVISTRFDSEWVGPRTRRGSHCAVGGVSSNCLWLSRHAAVPTRRSGTTDLLWYANGRLLDSGKAWPVARGVATFLAGKALISSQNHTARLPMHDDVKAHPLSASCFTVLKPDGCIHQIAAHNKRATVAYTVDGVVTSAISGRVPSCETHAYRGH